LLVDSTGKKFGKSEGNALFLDPKKTKPFEIYQYFINTPDADIEKYFLALTLLDPQEIKTIVNTHLQKPELREGQKRLAYEVVRIIHGQI
jgi:tyrosyl-tRNA synthetase